MGLISPLVILNVALQNIKRVTLHPGLFKEKKMKE